MSDEATDLSNEALLLFTDDTPVFIELIILIKPSKKPPFPVDDDVPLVPVPVPSDVVPVVAPVAVPVVVSGTVPDVEDDSLLVVVDTCCGGTGCDKALPNAGIGVPVVVAGCGTDDMGAICCGGVGNGGCTGGDICCCCC